MPTGPCLPQKPWIHSTFGEDCRCQCGDSMLVQLLCLEVSLLKTIIQKVWDYSFSGKIHAGFKVAAIALFSLLNHIENSGTLKTSSRSTCLHLAPYPLQLKARGLWKCHSSTSSLSSTPASHLDVSGPGSDRINGLFHLLINGLCWSYNPLIRSPLILTSNGTSK